jgi:hypothetical protein
MPCYLGQSTNAVQDRESTGLGERNLPSVASQVNAVDLPPYTGWQGGGATWHGIPTLPTTLMLWEPAGIVSHRPR